MKKYILIVASLLLIGVLVIWFGTDRNRSTAASSPDVKAPQAESTDNPAHIELSKTNSSGSSSAKVPIFIEGGAAIITLKVRAWAEHRILIRVHGEKRPQRPEQLRWADLLHASAFIALQMSDSAPNGMSIEVESDGIPAHIEQLAALTKAIQLALLRRPYPPGRLAIGLVTPSGTVFSGIPLKTRQTRAKSYGFELWSPPALSFTKQEIVAPRAEEVELPDDSQMRKALVSALGAIMAKKAYDLPLKANTDSLIERIETLAISNPIHSLSELIQHAQLGAQLNESIQALRFSTQRIAPFVQRLVDKNKTADGWRLAWLTQLIQARIHNEARLNKTLRKAAQPFQPKTGFSLPSKWLNLQTQQLTDVGGYFRALLRSTVKDRVRQPRPFPFCDTRLLAWRTKGLETRRAPIVEWGVQLHHLAVMWSLLVTKVALQPLRLTDSAEPEGISIKSPDTLNAMLAELKITPTASTSERRKIEQLVQGWESIVWQRQLSRLRTHQKGTLAN